MFFKCAIHVHFFLYFRLFFAQKMVCVIIAEAVLFLVLSTLFNPALDFDSKMSFDRTWSRCQTNISVPSYSMLIKHTMIG